MRRDILRELGELLTEVEIISSVPESTTKMGDVLNIISVILMKCVCKGIYLCSSESTYVLSNGPFMLIDKNGVKFHSEIHKLVLFT